MISFFFASVKHINADRGGFGGVRLASTLLGGALRLLMKGSATFSEERRTCIREINVKRKDVKAYLEEY